MNKYSQGKIYCIKSHNCDLVYIGSTIQKLETRFNKHKSHYKMGDNVKSGEILKYGNCYIELIKDFPCGSRSELCREEGKLQLEMDCVNHRIAGRTKEEWYQKNKEERNEYSKKYREKNKEERNEYQKQYHQKNKERINKRACEKFVCDICGSVVGRTNMLRHKKSMKCARLVHNIKLKKCLKIILI